MKNSAKIFLFDADYDLDSLTLAITESIDKHIFGPLTGDVDESYGWVPIWNSSGVSPKIEFVEDILVLMAQRKFRKISSSTLEHAVVQRWQELEKQDPKNWKLNQSSETRTVAQQKRELKTLVHSHLIKQALPKFKNFEVMISTKHRHLVIFNATWSQCDEILSLLRKFTSSLKVKALGADGNYKNTISNWARNTNLPAQVAVCIGPLSLKNTSDKTDRVTYSNQSASANEVVLNLENDRYLTKVCLEFKSYIEFVVNEDLSISNVKYDPIFKELLLQNQLIYSQDKAAGEFCYEAEMAKLALESLTFNELISNVCSSMMIDTLHIADKLDT